MCGIAGIFSYSPTPDAAALSQLAEGMGNALRSRGPDSGAVWADASQGVALAHRRLSIIDLSPDAGQPMHSASGRYVLSYNGEIYNYRELRAQLDYPWQSQSDTEVLLAAIENWGIEKSLNQCNGMFAFSLWDRQERTLTLARDRMGEKPLYYGWLGDQFVFASELKAFHGLTGWPPTINRNALNLLMRYSYIPAPHSIYERIYKLMPATYLQLKAGQMQAEPIAYWSYTAMVASNTQRRFTGSLTEATDALAQHLSAAVKQRMVADVPLGAFLSGGIDSSIIAALMQAQSSQPIETFTIGFAEPGFDEAPYAAAVAKHLGTAHHALYVSPREAMDVIPNLPTIYDEPFADSSQIPTHLVAKFARRHVTVALSGDGGDELFGSYRRYISGPAIWKILSLLPPGARHATARMLSFMHRKRSHDYEKLAAHSPQEFYRNLCSMHLHPEQLVMGGHQSVAIDIDDVKEHDYAEWMMLQDALTYFPDDILTKVDRAAMAASLETRTPFTDLPLMEFAWQLPRSMKLHGNQGKFLLRQLLYRHVPPALIDRPKSGFAVPIGAWLRGPLHAWATDLLATESLTQQGFFHLAAVEKLWREHQSGMCDRAKPLWNILMFQQWLANTSSADR